MMLRLGSEKVIPFVLRTQVLCSSRFLCSPPRVILFFGDDFNFRFIHERMFREELDDYPEVIQSSFLTLKQSARTVLG